MAFKDLAAHLDPDLHLPFRKKVYTVPAADMATGLWLQDMFHIGIRAASGADPTEDDAAKLDDGEERDFVARCLGDDLLANLNADKVPFTIISLMAQTLMVDTVAGRETAEEFWKSGGKAQAAQGRRTGTQTRQGAAATTRKPASRNGTKAATKAKASSGGTS